MPTLGEELRRRREERGTTLNDISEATRIGTRFLKAIESDSFSILPGGIFTRSFIRAFAKQVGMNEDEAISQYQQQITGPLTEPQTSSTDQRSRTAPAAVEPVRQVTTVEPRPRRADPITFRQTPTRANWPTIIIAGGIALFVVIIVIALVKQLNQSTTESAPQTATSPAPAQPAEPPPPAPAQTNQPPASGSDAQGAITVKIEALDGSWVQYRVDDNKPVSRIMKKGQVEEVPLAQSQVKLDYGTAKTLKLTVNNREVSFPPGAVERDGHILISRDSIQPLK